MPSQLLLDHNQHSAKSIHTGWNRVHCNCAKLVRWYHLVQYELRRCGGTDHGCHEGLVAKTSPYKCVLKQGPAEPPARVSIVR